MNRLISVLAAATFFAAAASSQAGTQAGGSASTGAGVQAGQTNAGVSSSTSADANAQASHKQADRDANGAANAGNSGSASLNGTSVSTSSSGAASLAAGTTIPVTLTKPVDARKCRPGDEVTAKTTQDIRSESGVVIPRGSRLVGHVTDAKAKAKGDSESALGIAFDRAVLRNGQQVPLNASIKALAAATGSMSTGEDNFGAASASTLGAGAAPAGGRGGLLGGTGGAVAGAGNTVGNVAGGAVGGVDNAAGSVGAEAGTVVRGAGSAGQLTSQSQGVIGLRGLSLETGASNSTRGSVIASPGKDVKLDSGTQMLLQVNQQ